MAWRDFTTYRNLVVFVVAILCCLILPSTFRNKLRSLFYEFQAPIDSVTSQLSDLQKFWSLSSNSKTELIEAGRDLARINAANTLKLMENEALKRKVARLESILQLPSEESFKSEVARVVRRDIGAWQQQLTIRKGLLHGIKEGYAVIYGGGVVGRIYHAGLYTSDVMLVGSRKFRMAARFENDERAIIYQGSGSSSMHTPHGEVTNVPDDFTASESNPLRLVTSSLAGTFPDGIFIGKVTSLSQKSDGIFKLGRVDLDSKLSSLREVCVLIPVSDLKQP